jgi:membrane-associated HD superfamily phosphohydrolase
MSKLLQTLKRISTLENLLIITGLKAIITYIVNNGPFGAEAIKKLTGFKILDFEISYSSDKAYQIIDGYGTTGRNMYLRFLLTDFAFILVYTMFSVIFLTLVCKKLFRDNNPVINVILIAVLAVGLFDILEDTGILTMLVKYPAKPGVIAVITSYITMIKSTLALVVTVLTMLLPFGLIFKQNKKTKE